MATASLAVGPGSLRIPLVDAAILDALIADPRLGIANTLELFRVQTSTDPRPNMALRPWLYRNLANASVPVHSRRIYIGAINGAAIATAKLLADYYKGRCLIASLVVLSADPGFHSSAFALVPKEDQPLHLDGRIIHVLSAPTGMSVNDLTDSTMSPDAIWNHFLSIALRIRDLRRRYPGYAIYAMVADIADSFHHVPIQSRHASAFGGTLPRSEHGIISGMAMFGWTSSPGFFAVFGKAVRHYQRTGASRILSHMDPFWSFQWVGDIVLIEVDIDDRLRKPEKRLRDGVKLVFGSDHWHEGKFTTWSFMFHAVGIGWNIPDELITVPQRKIHKVHRELAEIINKTFVTMKQVGSLVVFFRHVISFTPSPYQAIHTAPGGSAGTVPQSSHDGRCHVGVPSEGYRLVEKYLVFQKEFAGIPMRLQDRNPDINDIWLVQTDQQTLTITSMTLRERLQIAQGNQIDQVTEVVMALARVACVWGPRLESKDAWRHITIHTNRRWITRISDKMSCRSTVGQDALRQCALSQAQHRLHFATHTFSRRMDQTPKLRCPHGY